MAENLGGVKGRGPGVLQESQSRDQKKGDSLHDVKPEFVAPGGPILKADPKPDSGNPIGTVPGWSQNKPYKLTGG
jgi:hypothetical protein